MGPNGAGTIPECIKLQRLRQRRLRGPICASPRFTLGHTKFLVTCLVSVYSVDTDSVENGWSNQLSHLFLSAGYLGFMLLYVPPLGIRYKECERWLFASRYRSTSCIYYFLTIWGIVGGIPVIYYTIRNRPPLSNSWVDLNGRVCNSMIVNAAGALKLID